MSTEATTLAKARLVEVSFNDDGEVQDDTGSGLVVPIQFNPETLKVTYQVRKANDDQQGGSAVQYTGPGETKLAVDLVFDTTVPVEEPPQQPGDDEQVGSGAVVEGEVKDVRVLTRAVNYFLRPKDDVGAGEEYAPPGVLFTWGSFYFAGVMDSMNETLEFFSNEGRPLRASVSISITQQKVDPKIAGANGRGTSSPDAGASQQQQTPRTTAREGESVQQHAARTTGNPSNWRDIAERNDIENPRRIPAGTQLA